MSHRRIYQSDKGFLVRETGSGRDVAFVPKDELFEVLGSAEKHAKQIKHLPAIIDLLRQRAAEGDREAARLLRETQ